MSEKRQRKQQRRARRRAGGGALRRQSHSARRAADGQETIDDVMVDLAGIAAGGADKPADALEAEQWASGLLSTFHVGPLQDRSMADELGNGLVRALAKLQSDGALATLRAIGTLEGQACASRARAAADGLAGAGAREPRWADDVGRARPLAAVLTSEASFDDGVSVMVEFAYPGGDRHTLGVYIDHNMGGLVKDVFVAGPLSDVRATFEATGAADDGLVLHELDLGEARARVERALDILDHTLDPPVSDDVGTLRALIGARIALLPEGITLPEEYVDVAPEERERLLDDFLAAPEGRRWRNNADTEDAVGLAIDFGADYNHGGPLRWSPVVVEIFMTSWLARKVSMDRAFFERVPEVLADWVAYAGRRRGVSDAALREAVAAVELFREEMLESLDDSEAWGPAKAFALAAQAAGVDLSDPDAVEAFVERYNDGLAA
jgi:hypothetical protein